MKRAMHKVERRTKRVIKNIRKKSNESKQKRKFVAGLAVITVGEMCEFLKIEMPRSVENKQDLIIYKTPQYIKVRNKIKVFNGSEAEVLNQRSKEKFTIEVHKTFERRGRLFRKRYNDSKLFQHNDEQLFQMAIEWYCLYLPLGFSASDYFDFKLYDKSIEEAVKFIDYHYKKKLSK